ncbi:hypothetical protein [Oscillospiraceae bacterium]|nr:hypothetical protein [Oscillospiraceae bacterium]
MTAFHSALPHSIRQLSEASVENIFPRHGIWVMCIVMSLLYRKKQRLVKREM